MPYKTTKGLPESLQKNLPKHAQEIYLEALNNAFEEYKDPSKRRNKEEDIEAVAHKVAWMAVKKEYKKAANSDKWIKK